MLVRKKQRAQWVTFLEFAFTSKNKLFINWRPGRQQKLVQVKMHGFELATAFSF